MAAMAAAGLPSAMVVARAGGRGGAAPAREVGAGRQRPETGGKESSRWRLRRSGGRPPWRGGAALPAAGAGERRETEGSDGDERRASGGDGIDATDICLGDKKDEARTMKPIQRLCIRRMEAQDPPGDYKTFPILIFRY